MTYHAAYEPQARGAHASLEVHSAFRRRTHPNLPNCDDGPSKTYWLQNGWRDRVVDREQLCDLVFDPNETRNIAGDPSVKPALEEMRTRLDRWMHDTHDPILRGPIQAPAGALANDPDGTSPNEPPRVAG